MKKIGPPFVKSSQIAAYLKTALSQIRVANGYETDIGRKVLDGRRKTDETYVPYCVLIEAEDRPTPASPHGTEHAIEQDYVFGAYVECDPDHPNDAARAVIRDIKRALWGGDNGTNLGWQVQRFKYQGRDIGPRLDGEPVVFAVVHATAVYVEDIADA